MVGGWGGSDSSCGCKDGERAGGAGSARVVTFGLTFSVTSKMKQPQHEIKGKKEQKAAACQAARLDSGVTGAAQGRCRVRHAAP